MKRRILIAALLSLAFAAPAVAHPHVWVTMNSEVLYAPDGTVTGVRHAWSFDDMFSAFATQGYEGKVKGEFTREELAPLAKVNVESLKDFDYFTYATVDGNKIRMNEPLPDYYLSFENQVLTLHFTLPLEKPVKAKQLNVDIYDATIFVNFEFGKKDPVKLTSAPAGCKLETVLPREMTFAEGKALSEIPADQPNVSMAFGAKFANKILVNCP
ncbi:MAG: DUF1007 family protein [Pseudolabrys sp.]|nr:DUF1007 family protein [Pseudolabrys sp.]